MKRLTAIFFLALFLFNLIGYRLVLSLAETQSDRELLQSISEERIDPQYLVSIKTPLALPYFYNSENYESAHGTIEMNGVEYQYVKRRVFNDSLELLCYPNLAKKKWQQAKDAFFKLTSELPAQGKGKKEAPVKKTQAEYDNAGFESALTLRRPASQISKSRFDFHLPSVYLKTPERPPEMAG